MTTREAKISEEQGSMDADLNVGDEVEVFLSEDEVERANYKGYLLKRPHDGHSLGAGA